MDPDPECWQQDHDGHQGFVLMTIYAVVFLVQAVRCLPAKLKEGGPTE